MSNGKLFIVVGGVQLTHWTKYPQFIWLALKVRKAALASPGCTHVDIFQSGRLFHNVTVWDSPADMKRFARSGLHGDLMANHRGVLLSSFSHSFVSDRLPDRIELARIWAEANATARR